MTQNVTLTRVNMSNTATGPWRDMNDAPKDGTPVLMMFEDGIACVASYEFVEWPDGDETKEWVCHHCGEVIEGGKPVMWAEIHQCEDEIDEN